MKYLLSVLLILSLQAFAQEDEQDDVDPEANVPSFDQTYENAKDFKCPKGLSEGQADYEIMAPKTDPDEEDYCLGMRKVLYCYDEKALRKYKVKGRVPSEVVDFSRVRTKIVEVTKTEHPRFPDHAIGEAWFWEDNDSRPTYGKLMQKSIWRGGEKVKEVWNRPDGDQGENPDSQK